MDYFMLNVGGKTAFREMFKVITTVELTVPTTFRNQTGKISERLYEAFDLATVSLISHKQQMDSNFFSKTIDSDVQWSPVT